MLGGQVVCCRWSFPFRRLAPLPRSFCTAVAGAFLAAMGQAESVPAQQGGGGPPLAPSALVIVGPSGVGKGTLINRLMEGDQRYGFSCSHTTRPPREGEVVSEPARALGC